MEKRHPELRARKVNALDWHYACSESGYTDSHISLEWLTRVFDPETKGRAGSRPRVLICDGFGTHGTLEILEHCFTNDIILCRLLTRFISCSLATSQLLRHSRRLTATMLSGWSVAALKRSANSISPLYMVLHVALRSLRQTLQRERLVCSQPKPANELAIINEGGGGSPVQDTVLRTLLTPVSAEALMSLQSFIVQQDACTLGETSKQRLEEHLQKLTKAASTFHTTTALQKDQIQFLYKMNNEAKVRRSMKSLALGKARVMSYDDLVATRVKRAEKDAAQEHKKKSSRRHKRKDVLDSDALDSGGRDVKLG